MTEHPRVIGFPPYITLCPLVTGLVLQFILPLEWPLPEAFRWLGAPLVLAGYLLFNSTLHLMRAHETNPSPFKPSTKILKTGAFQFSRNPIYLGFLIIYLGLTLLAQLPWAALLFIPLVFVIRFGLIAREEEYLLEKFGQDYEVYQKSVRRWF
jgi:protein-S-isoprenylcysteine O-methyltransferase Ste14